MIRLYFIFEVVPFLKDLLFDMRSATLVYIDRLQGEFAVIDQTGSSIGGLFAQVNQPTSRCAAKAPLLVAPSAGILLLIGRAFKGPLIQRRNVNTVLPKERDRRARTTMRGSGTSLWR